MSEDVKQFVWGHRSAKMPSSVRVGYVYFFVYQLKPGTVRDPGRRNHPSIKRIVWESYAVPADGTTPRSGRYVMGSRARMLCERLNQMRLAVLAAEQEGDEAFSALVRRVFSEID